MEAFKDDILRAEIPSVSTVLYPPIGKCLLWIGRSPAPQVGDSFINPGFQETKIRAYRHVIVVDDLLSRVPIGENGIEALPNPADSCRYRIAMRENLRSLFG